MGDAFQKFLRSRMSTARRHGPGTAMLMAGLREQQERVAAAREFYAAALREAVLRGQRDRIFARMLFAATRAMKLLNTRARAVRPRRVRRPRQSSRSAATGDPDPAPPIDQHLRSKMRPLCGSRRPEAFFVEHKNENTRPRRRAFSKGGRDAFTHITTGFCTR
jgi:hypothetical protein